MMRGRLYAGLSVVFLLVSGIGAGFVGVPDFAGLSDGSGEGSSGSEWAEGGASRVAGSVGLGLEEGVPGGIELWGFVHQLMGVSGARSLSDEERALLVVEVVSRYHVESLGLVWSEDVFVPEHRLPSEAIRDLTGHLGGVIGPEEERVLGELDALPVGVRDALTDVVVAFHSLDLAASNVNAGIDVDGLEGWVDSLDSGEVPVEGLEDVFAARLGLVRAAFGLKGALEGELEESGEEAEVPSLMVPMGHGDPDQEFEVEGLEEDDPLLVCINSHDGNNVYSDDCLLLIDTSLEGDKKYHNNAGGRSEEGVLEGANSVPASGAAALIDFAGENEYGDPNAPRDQGANGGAHKTGLTVAHPGVVTGALLSLGSGDGRFVAGSQGVNGGGAVTQTNALWGGNALGFLLSMGGDDVFVAEGQGVNGGAHRDTGFHGVVHGSLLNMAGDDTYVTSEGGGVNGGASGTGIGLLFDLDGMNRYQDPSLPDPDHGSYVCMEQPGGNCGFEERGNTRFCWNCSVVPKGQHGMQVDFGALDDPVGFLEGADLLESDEDFPTCELPLCQRLFFRGEYVGDGLGMPNVANAETTGRLLPEAPSGTVPVIHSGTDGVSARQSPPLLEDTVRSVHAHVELISEPFDEPVAIGRGGAVANLNNAVDARFFLADWTRFTFASDDYRLKINAVQIEDAPVDNTRVALGEIAFNPGTASLVPEQRAFNIPLSVPSDNTDPVDPDGNPIPHYNEDFDIVVPEGYALEFVFWVDSESLQMPGLAFSVFYDSVSFPGHIDFRVTETFEPTDISIAWDDGNVELDDDGTLNFTAGEPVEFWARGYNETGGFVQNVTAGWNVEPAERGTFSTDDEDLHKVVFTPMQSGGGNITSIFHGTEASVNDTVDIWVKKGPISQWVIRDGPSGEGNSGLFEFVLGESATLYLAGYDQVGNFIEDVEEDEWRVIPNERGAINVDENGVVTFLAEEPGTGRILAGAVGDVLAEVDIEVALGGLDTITIQTEDEDGLPKNRTDLGELEAGVPIDVIAAGFDEFDNFLGNVTDAVWSVDPPEQGVFIEQGDQAVFEPRIVGVGVMTASHDGVESDPVEFEVIPGEPAQIGVQEPQEWAIDQSVSFAVRVMDEFANEIQTTDTFDGLEVAFTLIKGDGDLIGDKVGTIEDRRASFQTGYCCTVEEDGIEIGMNAVDADGNEVFEGVFNVDLVPGPLARLEIQDDLTNQVGPFELTAGDNLGLVAAGFDAHDNEKGLQNVEWALTRYADEETNEILEGSATGFLFWPEAAGSAQISIHSGTVTDSVVIQVHPADLSVIRIFNEPGDHDDEDQVTALGPFTAGDEKSLFAAGYDSFDNFLGQVPVGWHEEPEEIGSVNTTVQATTVRFTAGKTGTGFLNVSHPVLAEDLSIDVVVDNHGPTPRELAFQTQGDMEIIAGETWPEIMVRIEDGFGNRVLSDNSTQVTLKLGKGYEESLQGQLTVTAQEGLAVFEDVSYEVADSVWIAAEADAEDEAGESLVVHSASMGPYHVLPAELDWFQIEIRNGGEREQATDLQLQAGASIDLFAAGFDRFDNYAGDVGVEWSISPDSLGSFSADADSHTVFMADQEGTGTITAIHEGIGIESVGVQIRPGILDHVLIRTAPGGAGEEIVALQVDAGEAVELFVAGYDASSNYVGDVTAWWRVDPPRLGVLDQMDASVNTTFIAESRGTGRIVVDPEDLPGDVEIPLVVDDDPVPPTAGFTVTCDELECFLDASSSKRGDAAIQGHQWNLGDGTTRSGQSFFHSYKEDGEYTVTLNVTARDGLSDETTETVRVNLSPNAEVRLQVTPDPENPRPGDAVTATAMIENVGRVDLGAFRVEFYVDEELVRAQDYPRLRVGESMNVRTMWGALEGEQLISVEVPGYASESRLIVVGDPVPVEGTDDVKGETDDGDDVVVDGVEEASGFGWMFVVLLVLGVIGMMRQCRQKGVSWWWNAGRMGPTASDPIVSREGLSSPPIGFSLGIERADHLEYMGTLEHCDPPCLSSSSRRFAFRVNALNGPLGFAEGAVHQEIGQVVERQSDIMWAVGVCSDDRDTS